MWQNGTKRGDVQLGDFEDLIRKGAFNEKGKVIKIVIVMFYNY
jgi:hypothetical protein